MILLRNFNRQFGVIRLEQFGEPKIGTYNQLELPRGSILHYVPTSGISEVGPPQTLPMFENCDKVAIQINHIMTLTDNNILGRPKRIEKNINRDLMVYHRVNKRMRRMHNTTMVEKDDRTLMVENYAPLRSIYRYPQTIMAWYDRFHNLASTVFEQMGADADKYERQSYLLLSIPTTLPSKSKLRLAERKRDQITLADMRDENTLFFLELWTWLGKHRSDSVMNGLTRKQLISMNIILQFNDKFVNLNLGELDFWRKDGGDGSVDSQQMQKRLYRTVTSLAMAAVEEEPDVVEEEVVEEEPTEESTTEKTKKKAPVKKNDDIADIVDRGLEDVPDEEYDVTKEVARFDAEDALAEDDDDDFEIIKKSDDSETKQVMAAPITIDNGIDRACTKYIDAGTMPTKAYQKLLEKSNNYKTIQNPFGDGTVNGMLEVTPEDVAITPEVMFDDETLFDKTMALSVAKQFNRDYIKRVLPKDIIKSVMSVQRAGMVVEDYKVDRVINAANKLYVHTLRLQPVQGVSEPLRFTTPMVDEEGYWVANEIRYTMRKQKVDLPIRKTADDTVSLTTFYGRNVVRRCQSAATNRPAWLTNNLISKGLDADQITLRDLVFSNVFDSSFKLPRDYTSIAKRLSKFTAGDTVYYFDISKLEKNFSKEDIDEFKKQSLTPVGKSRSAVYGMDMFSVVYKKTKSGIEEVGSLVDIVGISKEKMPKEYTEMSIMMKNLPLVIILSYYGGFQNLLKEYGVSYRIAEAGERVPKGEGDMVIPMVNGKFVLVFDTQEQEMLFQGMKGYLPILRDFSIDDLDKKDIYLNLIQKDGLGVRYLNELDLMETMYVDPISERMLIKMKEPTDFKGLLRRSNELLMTDWHNDEVDLEEMHIYGYQRIAGHVYTGLVRAIRNYNNKPGTKKKIDLPNSEIWASIASDPSVAIASDANAIQPIKEADVVTTGGTNGRSGRSMVKSTRKFTTSDLGVMSGDTVDSGDAGTTTYLSANPDFATLDGMVAKTPKSELKIGQLISSAAMLSPSALYDDDKRLTINIV